MNARQLTVVCSVSCLRTLAVCCCPPGVQLQGNKLTMPNHYQPRARRVSTSFRFCVASLTAALMFASIPFTVAAQSLSCSGSLVSKGDSPVSLLQKCGEPIYRQHICLSMLQLGWVVTPFQPGSPNAILASQCVPMEEWTYDRGPGTFLGVVRLYNGSIESVRDGDRSR